MLKFWIKSNYNYNSKFKSRFIFTPRQKNRHNSVHMFIQWMKVDEMDKNG